MTGAADYVGAIGVNDAWFANFCKNALFQRWYARKNVRQYDQSDCGPAALLSILRFHGGNESLPYLRQVSGTDMHGTTLLNLAGAAEAVGFAASGAIATYDDLIVARLPCIVHLRLHDGREHYVVIYSASISAVWIGDPSDGVKRWRADEFRRQWDGVVLLLEPTSQLAHRPPPSTWRWAIGYFRRDHTWIIQSVFLGAAYTAISLTTAGAMHWVVDAFIPSGDRRMLLVTAALLGCLAMVRVVIGYVRQRFLIGLGTRFGDAITGDFLEHIFALPADFFGTRKAGDLTTRVRDNLRIQAAVLRILGNAVSDSLIVAGSLAFFYVLAPPLAWVVFGSAITYTLVGAAGIHGLRDRQHAVMHTYAVAEACCIDSLNGIEEISGFAVSDPFVRKNRDLQSQFQAASARLTTRQAALSTMVDGVGGLLLILCLVSGALFVLDGRLLLGEMMAAYGLLAATLPSIGRLADSVFALQGAAAAVTRMMDMLLVAREGPRAGLPFVMEHACSVEDGAFAWRTGEVLFHDINITIRVGEVTGLWGDSGTGKSTLVRVLERKCSLTEGRIMIDGTGADRFALPGYRSSVAVIPETVKIFNGTLEDNINLGRATLALQPIDLVVDRIGVASFFRRFPSGLRTVVGEDGRRLSSGERQLIALLRALVGAPRLLVLDEGFNAVDPETAALIMHAVREHARTSAVLLISHDVNTIAACDRLYVLAHGTLSQPDNARELMSHRARVESLNQGESADGESRSAAS